MCHHQENPPRTDWNEEARRQANMYPNLDEFLRRLMPENQSEFLRDFLNANVRSENEPNIRPSAPPENTERRTENNNQAAGGWNWNMNWQYPTENMPDNQENDGGRQNRQSEQLYGEDDVLILLQRLGQMIAANFAKAIGFIAFMLPILIVPKFFLVLGIFGAFMKSFGIPLTPLVIGGIFYEILAGLDPILITLLAVWTIYKTWILKRPLVDVRYWSQSFRARCNSSRH